MKLLLDECLPLDFRHSFTDHTAHTAQWAGLKGRGNGDLLRAAEVAGYDAFLTVDQGIPFQKSTSAGKLAIIVIRPRTNQMEDLLPLVSTILTALNSIHQGQIVTLP